MFWSIAYLVPTAKPKEVEVFDALPVTFAPLPDFAVASYFSLNEASNTLP